jgi:hypothetical protein
MSLKVTIGKRLQTAIQECSFRGLFQASNWAAEQLIGLEEGLEADADLDIDSQSECQISLIANNETVYPKEMPSLLLGSSLLAIGQYQRCAHNLQHFVMSGKCSNLALFLYAYSKYLAGEKNRLQTVDEKPKRLESYNKGKSKKTELGFVDLDEPPKNSFLKEIYNELLRRYISQNLDSYLLYIFAVVLRDYIDQFGQSFEELARLESPEADQPLQPQLLFMQSLAANPWNW